MDPIQKRLEEGLNGIDDGIRNVMDRLTAIETYNRKRKLGMGGAGVSLPGVNEGKDKFSLAKAFVGLAAQSGGKDIWKDIDANYEKEVMREATTKALDTGLGGGGGGFVVPVEAAADFIEVMSANAVCLQAGVTQLHGLRGSPVPISKQLTRANVFWLAQNTTIPKSDISLGSISMQPRTMAIRSQHSNLLQALSNPNIETIVRNDFGSLAGVELDRVILLGAGAAEPVGLADTPNMPLFTIADPDGGYLDWDLVTDVEGVLEDKNAMKASGSFGYVFNPKIKRRLKKLRIPQWNGDPAGAYVMPPIMSDRLMEEMLGHPMFTTTQLRTNLTKGGGTDLSEFFFANWADIMVGFWGSLEILATNIGGDAWAQNAIEIRLIQNVDVSVRNLESVVYCKDARTI